MKILLDKIVTNHSATKKDGKTISKMIEKHLNTNSDEIIEINFEGVKKYTTTFFKEICMLIKTHTNSEEKISSIMNKLKLIKIDDYTLQLFDKELLNNDIPYSIYKEDKSDDNKTLSDLYPEFTYSTILFNLRVKNITVHNASETDPMPLYCMIGPIQIYFKAPSENVNNASGNIITSVDELTKSYHIEDIAEMIYDSCNENLVEYKEMAEKVMNSLIKFKAPLEDCIDLEIKDITYRYGKEEVSKYFKKLIFNSL